MSAKSRKRGIIIIIIALLAVAGGVLWAAYPTAKDKMEEVILEKALSDQEDLANIVFKMFSLTQGEGGLEAWRLKAEVASVRKDSGLIHVEAPRITYFTRPDNQEVQVSAAQGVVDQGERNMELWPDVLVVKDGNTLKTTKLVYTGVDHMLVFPDELVVESKDMLGTAKEASWNLKTNVFEAWGGVTIHFKPQPKTQQNDSGANSENAPLTADNATQPASAE